MEKIKFTTLDAIRGLAAIFVVIRHSGEFFGGNPFYNSFLAVDIFFLLSGFVIAHAYDKKLSTQTLSIKDFFALRLIRLYPLYFLSIGLCILVMFLNYFLNNKLNTSISSSIISTLLAIVFIPNILQAFSSTAQLFPINSVYWSLFYELIVNFMLAIFKRWLHINIIIFLIILSASLIFYFGIKDKNIDAGDSWGIGSIALGSARAFFGIFIGYYLYKFKERFTIPTFLKKATLGPLIIICLILATPKLGQVNWLYQLLSVFILFPVCILWSANTNQHSVFLKPMIILGALSYPAYVMHVPITKLLNLFMSSDIKTNAPLSGFLFLIVFFISCVFLEKNIEQPLRRLLRNMYFSKAKN